MEEVVSRINAKSSGVANGGDPLKNSQKVSKVDKPEVPTTGFDASFCTVCNKKITGSMSIMEECWHYSCANCIRDYIINNYVNSKGSITCPAKDCKNTIQEMQIKEILGHDKYEELQKKSIRKILSLSMIECVKCHTEYEFTPGRPSDAPAKDINGHPLSQACKENFANNRFICPKPDCKTEQCRECKSVPFHISISCKEYRSKAEKTYIGCNSGSAGSARSPSPGLRSPPSRHSRMCATPASVKPPLTVSARRS
jgi:E3 ubiquitin-protein ligase MYCBP2